MRTAGITRDVAVSGTYVYVADAASGLQIHPSQCSSTPIFLTSFTLSASTDHVEVRWVIRIAEDGGEFRLSAVRGEAQWDVPIDAQPGPTFVAVDRSPRLAEGGDVLYKLFYRDLERGWLMLTEQSIAFGTTLGPARLLVPYPNPAMGRVVIPYSAGRSGNVRLTVHDVAGREVAHVFEGTLRPGAGQWIWSVEDSRRGGQLASGMYLIRLTTEQGVQTRKVVFMESTAR